MEPRKERRRRGDVGQGNAVADHLAQGVIVRRPEFILRQADEIENVADGLQVARDALPGVRHNRHGRDEQRGRNGDRSLGRLVLVVQAVLARDERRAVSLADIVAGLGRPDQSAEAVGLVAVAPTEVVENGRPCRVAANGHGVAHRFVDGARRHGVRVNVGVLRVHAIGDGDTLGRPIDRRDDRRVTRAVLARADQRLHNARALDLVVVLANHPVLRADVPRRQNGLQVRSEVGLRLRRRLLVVGLPPCGDPSFAGDAAMEKFHVQLADLFAVVEQLEPLRVGELADDRRLDVLGGEERHDFVQMLRRHADRHSFLGFGDPDLGVGEPGILQRHLLEMHAGAEFLAHLAHRT